MSLKMMIEHTLGVSDMIIGKYLADLDTQGLLVRPVPGMNHLAWQMGHLISSERRFVEIVKPGTSPALPDGFEEQHGRDKHDDDDPAHFLTRDEYLALWNAQRAATKQALAAMTDEELAAPCPDEKMRGLTPTVGTILGLGGLHALMHSGQFVAVRRQQELPIAF